MKYYPVLRVEESGKDDGRLHSRVTTFLLPNLPSPDLELLESIYDAARDLTDAISNSGADCAHWLARYVPEYLSLQRALQRYAEGSKCAK